VVRQAVQGISDLVQRPGIINLDFADVRTAMRGRGEAVMGIGVASGKDRVRKAAQQAISSPLLAESSVRGASSIIINVTGGRDLTLSEVQLAAEVVHEAVGFEAGFSGTQPGPSDQILLGVAEDPELDAAEGGNGSDSLGRVKVTVVATGLPDRGRLVTPLSFPSYRGGKRAAEIEANRQSGIRVVDPIESSDDRGQEGRSQEPREERKNKWGDLETPAFRKRTGGLR